MIEIKQNVLWKLYIYLSSNVNFTTLPLTQTPPTSSNHRVIKNNEMERPWNEAAVTLYGALTRVFLEGTEKNNKTTLARTARRRDDI
jgi:hypothetical protein